MNKKIMLILFTFLISFMCIGVRAEGFFEDVNGNRGNAISCTYRNSSWGYVITLKCEYDGNKVNCSSHQAADDVYDLKITNLSGVNSTMLNNNNDKEGTSWCPASVSVDYNAKESYFGNDKPNEKFKTCCDNYELKPEGNCCYEVRKNHNGATDGKFAKCILSSWDSRPVVADNGDEVYDKAEDIIDTQNLLDKFKKEETESQTDSTIVITDGCGLLSKEMAEFLQKALYLLVIGGVVLTVVLGLIDFVGAVTGAADDGIKKAWKKFIRRIISLAVLLILPALITFVLTKIDLTNVVEDSIFCGIETEY